MVAKAVVVHFRVGFKGIGHDENRHHQNHQRKTEDAVSQNKKTNPSLIKVNKTQHDQSADRAIQSRVG